MTYPLPLPPLSKTLPISRKRDGGYLVLEGGGCEKGDKVWERIKCVSYLMYQEVRMTR